MKVDKRYLTQKSFNIIQTLYTLLSFLKMLTSCDLTPILWQPRVQTSLIKATSVRESNEGSNLTVSFGAQLVRVFFPCYSIRPTNI